LTHKILNLRGYCPKISAGALSKPASKHEMLCTLRQIAGVGMTMMEKTCRHGMNARKTTGYGENDAYETESYRATL
jgi:hypothetical protein